MFMYNTLIPHKCSCSHTEGVQVHLESVIVFRFLLLLYDVFVLV